ncbi:MAG: LuxR C-terminal-related transcriptional regulator [Chitinophagales bacterium]
MPKSKNQLTTTVKEPTLSERELEVLHSIATGKSSKTIALELFISTNTIEAHRKQILKKMAAKNMVEAISIAFRKEIIR